MRRFGGGRERLSPFGTASSIRSMLGADRSLFDRGRRPGLRETSALPERVIFNVGAFDRVYNIAENGLVGDGVTDNQAALRALIGSNMAIYVPPGEFVLGRNPLPGATNIGTINLGGFAPIENLYFFGAGKASKFVMKGPGTAQTMFRVLNGARNIHFRNMMFIQGPIDDATPDEQMHLIEMAGIADFSFSGVGPTDCSVVDCWFGHVFGDQIRLLGEANTPTTRIRIANNQMDGQDHSMGYGVGYPQGQGSRSCVGVQRSCHQLTVIGNQMKGSKDQLIDYEPSGAQEHQDHDVIVGNTFDFSDRAQLITMGGDSAQSNHRRFIFEQNTIKGGRLFALNVSECSISNNIIVCDATSSGRAGIQVRRAGDRTRVHGNQIIIPVGSGALQGILITGDPAIAVPDGVSITDNQIFMENDMGSTGGGIHVSDAVDVKVDGNQVWLAGANIANTFGIIFQRNGTNMSRLSCVGNMIRNDSGTLPDSGICVSMGAGTVGAVTIADNQVESCGKGVRLVGGTTWSVVPVVAVNQIRNCTTPVSIETTGLVVCIGGNQGGVASYLCQTNGNPNSIAALDGVPIGSDYRDRAAGAGAKLWIKHAAGASGWTAAY